LSPKFSSPAVSVLRARRAARFTRSLSSILAPARVRRTTRPVDFSFFFFLDLFSPLALMSSFLPLSLHSRER
jgi:hypothetical protein